MLLVFLLSTVCSAAFGPRDRRKTTLVPRTAKKTRGRGGGHNARRGADDRGPPCSSNAQEGHIECGIPSSTLLLLLFTPPASSRIVTSLAHRSPSWPILLHGGCFWLDFRLIIFQLRTRPSWLRPSLAAPGARVKPTARQALLTRKSHQPFRASMV